MAEIGVTVPHSHRVAPNTPPFDTLTYKHKIYHQMAMLVNDLQGPLNADRSLASRDDDDVRDSPRFTANRSSMSTAKATSSKCSTPVMNTPRKGSGVAQNLDLKDQCRSLKKLLLASSEKSDTRDSSKPSNDQTVSTRSCKISGVSSSMVRSHEIPGASLSAAVENRQPDLGSCATSRRTRVSEVASSTPTHDETSDMIRCSSTKNHRRTIMNSSPVFATEDIRISDSGLPSSREKEMPAATTRTRQRRPRNSDCSRRIMLSEEVINKDSSTAKHNEMAGSNSLSSSSFKHNTSSKVGIYSSKDSNQARADIIAERLKDIAKSDTEFSSNRRETIADRLSRVNRRICSGRFASITHGSLKVGETSSKDDRIVQSAGISARVHRPSESGIKSPKEHKVARPRVVSYRDCEGKASSDDVSSIPIRHRRDESNVKSTCEDRTRMSDPISKERFSVKSSEDALGVIPNEDVGTVLPKEDFNSVQSKQSWDRHNSSAILSKDKFSAFSSKLNDESGETFPKDKFGTASPGDKGVMLSKDKISTTSPRDTSDVISFKDTPDTTLTKETFGATISSKSKFDTISSKDKVDTSSFKDKFSTASSEDTICAISSRHQRNSNLCSISAEHERRKEHRSHLGRGMEPSPTSHGKNDVTVSDFLDEIKPASMDFISKQKTDNASSDLGDRRRLVREVREGNIDYLDALVKTGARLHKIQVDNKTILHVAASSSTADVISCLLDNGCDIEARDTVQANTALHLACSYCNAEVVHALIRRGADFNVPNANGETPLAKLLRHVTKNASDWQNARRLVLARELIQLGLLVFPSFGVTAMDDGPDNNKNKHNNNNDYHYDDNMHNKDAEPLGRQVRSMSSPSPSIASLLTSKSRASIGSVNKNSMLMLGAAQNRRYSQEKRKCTFSNDILENDGQFDENANEQSFSLLLSSSLSSFSSLLPSSSSSNSSLSSSLSSSPSSSPTSSYSNIHEASSFVTSQSRSRSLPWWKKKEAKMLRLYDRLASEARPTWSLQQHCRLLIVRCIATRPLHESVGTLALPRMVKRYIVFGNS